LLLGVGSERPVAAADDIIELDPVVVSASYAPTALSDTASSVTVVGRPEIERQRWRSVVELLRGVPGLHIDLPGGRGGVSSVYLRGGDPNFTVVMVDGIVMNDPTNSRGGSFDFSTLDIESIERVEIVRGAGSAVHGSDALAGVINIVTRPGTTTPERTLHAEVGARGEVAASATAAGPAAVGTYAITAAYVDDGAPVDGSELRNWTLTGRAGLDLDEETWLEAVARYAVSDRRSFPEDSGGPEFAVLRETDSREESELMLGVELGREVSEAFDYRLRASYVRRGADLVSPGVAPGRRDPVGIPASSSEDRFDRLDARFIGDAEMRRETLWMTLGIDARSESGTSESTIRLGEVPIAGRFSVSRTSYAPFAELRWSPIPGAMLTGSARLDVPDDFDAELSTRLALRYEAMGAGTVVRASYGEGFKLPSFFALGHPLVGNPRLRPEASDGADLGVEQALFGDRASIGATVFSGRFFDLVDLEEGPPPRLVNRAKVIARGIEIAADVAAREDLTLAARMTYTDTDIVGVDEELRNRPRWRAGATLAWRPRPALDATLGLLYVGTLLDSSIPTGDRELDPYLRLDASARWSPRPNFQLSIAIDNLLDAEYEEVLGFPAPGVAARLRLRVGY
jgi:outer membrane cobalamin receptor